MGEHDRDGTAGGHAEPYLDAGGGAGQGRDPHGLEPDGAQPSWRARRGGEPDLRRMGKVAGGLVLALLAVAGGWSMLGRRPHEIPVIEAPSGPLRVRPENPGGMQLASGVDATPDGAGTLAPPPEVPQPGALRAQIQAGQAMQGLAMQGLAAGAAPNAAPSPEPGGVARDEAAAQALAAQTLAAQTLAAQTLAAQLPVAQGAAAATSATGGEAAGAAATPAARGAPAPGAAAAPGTHVVTHEAAHPPAAPAPAVPPAVAARPDAPAAAGAHGAAVQLAAMESEQGATAEWQRLSHRMPELLGSRHPDVQRADHDGHPVWRLRTGGFATAAQAAEFCVQVRAKGVACSIAAF